MSPIDDELRSTLSTRTASVRTGPDFFAGVERRARRMRRQRVATAVAGSALAVAALGLGGPLLASSLTSSADGPLDQATSAPAPDSRYALDPAAPWAYRGDPAVAVQGDLDAYTVEWATRHGVLTDDVTLVPLFGQVYEPSAAAESTTPQLVYLVTQRSTGEYWWGVAWATESGPILVVDARFTPSDRFGLAAVLPGEETSRLLVLAAPGTTPGYLFGNGDGVDGDDGVLLASREGDPDRDAFRVVAPGGMRLVEQRVPSR